MRNLALAALLALTLAAAGCASLSIGTTPATTIRLDPAHFTASATFALWEPYTGEIVQAGLLGRARQPNELVSIDVWPLGGAALAVAGARLRIMPFELGIGFLGYDPKPIVPPEESKGESTIEAK